MIYFRRLITVMAAIIGRLSVQVKLLMHTFLLKHNSSESLTEVRIEIHKKGKLMQQLLGSQHIYSNIGLRRMMINSSRLLF